MGRRSVFVIGLVVVLAGGGPASATVVGIGSGGDGDGSGDCSGDADAEDDGGISDAFGPGFGLLTAIAALLAGLALLARRP